MPFTPLHMGPGVVVKALLQGRFSLMVFGWSQVVMDIQPLVVMIIGEGHLHGFSHTYVGAVLLAVVSALSGKYLSELGLFILRRNHKWEPNVSWWIAFISAFIGTSSHVLLDSVMHSDVVPFYPVTEGNGLFGVISIEALHKICLYSALLGGGVYIAINHVRNLNRLSNKDALRRSSSWE